MYLAFHKFNPDVFATKLNRCMYFSVAENEVDVIKCYLEVLVKLLLRGVVEIGNSLLHMYTEYNYAQDCRRRDLLFDSGLNCINKFFNAYL